MTEKIKGERRQRETIDKIRNLLLAEDFDIEDRAMFGFTADRCPNDIKIRVWVKKTTTKKESG